MRKRRGPQNRKSALPFFLSGNDPLTRAATAGESAVAVHPLPQGGEGADLQIVPLFPEGDRGWSFNPTRCDHFPTLAGSKSFCNAAILESHDLY